MKYVKLLTVLAMVSAFATASFAGECGGKKKKGGCGDKPKVEETKK